MPRQRPPDTRDARRWPDRPPSTDRHAPAALRPAAERLPPRWHADPDEIETTCAACTLEFRDGQFVHERSCVFARTANRNGA